MALSQSIAVWADTTATAAQKLEAAGGLIPIVGNVIGLGEGISHRDPGDGGGQHHRPGLGGHRPGRARGRRDRRPRAAAGLHGSAGAGELLPPTQRSGQAVHQELHDRAPEPAAARPGGCVVRVRWCSAVPTAVVVGASPTVRATIERWRADPAAFTHDAKWFFTGEATFRPDCHTQCHGAAGWFSRDGRFTPNR